LTVFGEDYPTPDGTCIRDYVHVSDLAAAHVAALERLRADGPSSAYNLGYADGVSVRDVLAAVERVTGRPVAHTSGPRRAGDPVRLVAANARAVRELGWAVGPGQLDRIVQTAWDWHRRHPRGYQSSAS
jgi:UDP-glucose 4-epimerase